MEPKQWVKLQSQAVEAVQSKNAFLRAKYQDDPESVTIKVMIDKEFEKLLGLPEFENWLQKEPEKVA